MNAEQLTAAITAVVEYAWHDEREDYRDHEGDGSAHIFTTLVALDNWVNGTDFTPDSYVKDDREIIADVDIDFKQADLAAVQGLLRGLPANDFLGRLSLEARRDKLINEIKGGAAL